jgi:predicted CoA-binding protein
MDMIMDWKELLRDVRSVLVVDWPSRDIPETLARGGFDVVVRCGPGVDDYSIYESDRSGTVTRREGRAPEKVDMVYAHRPLSELPTIIATAKALHAKAIWTQSGLSGPASKDPCGCWMPEEEYQWARELVRLAGIAYFSEPYIADAVCEVRALRV